MCILLVEDDVKQLEPLHAALSEARHIVDGVKDSSTYLNVARAILQL